MSFDNLLRSSRIVGEPNTELTPEISASLGAAFGTLLKNQGTIVVSRDFRPESRMLKRAFVAGVMSAGLNIMDLTAAPIPVLQFAIRRFGTVGGAIFTTHHSQFKDKIDIKLYSRSGIEYSMKKISNLITICQQNTIKRGKIGEIGNIIQTLEINDLYERAITQFIDKSLFQSLDFRVVADCSNGPISLIIPSILSRVAVDVVALNSYTPSFFKPLPNFKSLKKLSKVISSTDATFGVCFDVDGSRVIFFDEKGNYISSDFILSLFVMEQLKKGSTIFITTMTTTTALEQIIEKVPDAKLTRVQNNPGMVANAIQIHRAHFGGSDTGKYRFPEYAFFSDTALAILKMLELIAKSGKTLTDLLADVPQAITSRSEIIVSDEILTNFHEILETNLGNLKIIDTLIGLKLYFGAEYGWIHVRPSLDEKKLLLTGEIVNPDKGPEMFKTIEYALEGKITQPFVK
ncbi:MAG TPA: hypothetical protein VMV49_03230 [Candidatus Deferrimicrobium sp.]|nr:hypothetical protein [Candidatus Deferrimicrobium sp.]